MVVTNKILSPVDFSMPETTPQASKPSSPEETVRAAKQFESFFVGFVFQTAYEAVPKSEFMNGGLGEDIFSSMFIEQVAAEMASGKKSLGLSEQIARQRGHGQGLENNDILRKKPLISEKM